MSEPIIIKTPQPDLEERLIVVDEATFAALLAALPGPLPVPRDAEPADLERAGWVRDSDLLALTVRAEAAEAERDEARDTIARARGCITDVPAGVRNALDIEVARLLRERDEARAERDEVRLGRNDALQVLGQAREALPSGMRGGWLVDAVRRLVRERDEAQEKIGAVSRALPGDRTARDLGEAVAQVVRERDEARAALAEERRQRDEALALASRLRCDLDRATDREDGVAAERARVVAYLRAEERTIADRIERGEHAKGEATAVEPVTPEQVREILARAEEVARYHREQERAEREPVPAPEPRATDEELADLFVEVRESANVGIAKARLAAVAAVAARVRREACLVTRAVEAGALFSIRPYVCKWIVIASHGGNDRRETVPAADVPKTLARLLGEVTRGR